MKKRIYTVGVVLSLLASSCDFERINTNEFEMTPEMGIMDGIAVGGPITAMQKCVIPLGTQADGTDIANKYQIGYHLSSDVWSGYFAQNNNWNGGTNNTTYFLMDGWLSASYRNSFSEIYPLWKDVKTKSEEANAPETFALAQIIKISAWHRSADMFGPIPYKKAGEPIIIIPYDSQEDVYNAFFTDLADAIEVLTPKAEQNLKLLPDYDAVYAGDTRKWVKYANSLMLRLAIRVRYADAALAQKYAELAINHPIGVMENKEDAAKLDRGANLVFLNNIEVLANQYNECRMGSSMFSYLMGYEDPRLEAYFKESDSEYAVKAKNERSYQAIPTGHDHKQNDTYKSFSKPNVNKDTPTYWMRASEVCFLRAEGALIGWNMGGSADDFYRQGIEMSFNENNVASSALEPYLKSDKLPMAYSVDAPGLSSKAAAPSTVSIKFEGSQENKLEKIMTQKWIALYPNGHEAWTEWRRTGYPKLHQVEVNKSGGVVNSKDGIRRMRYPITSGQSLDDIENMKEAVKLLGGPDSPATKLWWDKK